MKIFKAFRAFVTTLYEGTQNNGKRKYIQRVATDSHRTVNSLTRTEALSRARWLYANEGFTCGAVDAMARYSVGTGIIPQAQTKDEAWNEAAEKYFDEASKVIDIEGKHTLTELLKMYSRCIDVDGDLGVVLTESESGFPQIQTVLSHRIGSANDVSENMFDGIRVNANGRPISYRVLTDDVGGFEDVPAQNFIFLGEAKRSDEYRCISNLVHAITNIQDLMEIVSLEKQGVKLSAVPGLVKTTKNEDSGTDVGNLITGTNSTLGDIQREDLQGSLILALANGEKLESFSSNRPTPGLDVFATQLIKPVALGMGLPVQFVWNPESIGGAVARLVVHQAQRRFNERQQLLINRLLNRLYGWIISKGIKNGDLPQNDEWWKVSWQTPERITVDVGREAQQNREDIKIGLRTFAEDYAERGRFWQDELRQVAKEQAFIQKLSQEYGVPVDRISAISPNPQAQPANVSNEEEKK